MLSDMRDEKPKLGRKLALALLPLVLIPVLLIAGIAYWNTQSLLREKNKEQLDTALHGQLSVLNAFVHEQEGLLARLVHQPTFEMKLIPALGDPQDKDAAMLLNTELQLLLAPTAGTKLVGLFILDEINGEILFGTDAELIGETISFDPQIPFQTIPLANDVAFSSNTITFLSIKSIEMPETVEGNYALASVSSNLRLAELASAMHSFLTVAGSESNPPRTLFIAVGPDIVLKHEVDGAPFVIANTSLEPVFVAARPAQRIRFNLIN